MEEVRKQLRKIRNAGVLLLSTGTLLLLAGSLLPGTPRDSFLCLLGGFMALVGMAVLYRALKATRVLVKTGH